MPNPACLRIISFCAILEDSFLKKSTLSAYPTKHTKSSGLKHYDCFRIPKVLQYGNSNHPMTICRLFHFL